jgi:hypothetical protein
MLPGEITTALRGVDFTAGQVLNQGSADIPRSAVGTSAADKAKA